MAEQLEYDDASWSEVQVTLIFTAATSAIFLTIFEVARRSPILYFVFDRRRATKPNRTPPPLLRNTLFEWMFVSNAPEYIAYSNLGHYRDVILERRRQRKRSELSSILFGKHKNNNRNEEENKVELDRKVTASLSDDREEEKEEMDEEVSPTGSANSNGLKSVRFHANVDNSIELVSPTVTKQFRIPHNPSSSSSSSPPSSRPPQKPPKPSHNPYPKRQPIFKSYLTPDVVEVNGRRLPQKIAVYAQAGDLTQEQLEEYEQQLKEEEEADELDYQRKKRHFMEARAVEKSGGSMRLNGDVGQDSFARRVEFEDPYGMFDDAKEASITLPPRPSRFWYVGFQQGGSSSPKEGRPSAITSPNSMFGWAWTSGRSLFSRGGSGGGGLSSRYSSRSLSPTNSDPSSNHFNRHLKSVSVREKRPLSMSDAETLRCTGLDTFVMLRFLRFCFDVTFYPFVVSCVLLVAVYVTNDYDGQVEGNDDLPINTQVEGYFQYTINRIEPTGNLLLVPIGFSVVYYFFILWRLWIEWETFITLRYNFLANGDPENHDIDEDSFRMRKSNVAKKDDVQLHLEQFRNSCIVEFVPESHRRDQELFQFFDAVFPNQIKRAEILLNASELADMIKKRQDFIERYEKTYAKYNHAKQVFALSTEKNESTVRLKLKFLSCKRKKPEEPTIALTRYPLLCCGGRTEKALPYYLRNINKLNKEIEKEHKKIREAKEKVEDEYEHHDFVSDQLAAVRKRITGVGQDLTCDTGFIEFKNLAAKQSALQCNITGTNRYMVTTSAPDPRAMIWENATVEKSTIISKHLQCGGILFASSLFWPLIVATVTSMSDLESYKRFMPEWMIPKEETFWYDLIQGYIPVIFLESVMFFVPIILSFIAKKYIRFKTSTEVDEFVYKWHFAYRIWNLIIIIVKNQVWETFSLLRTDPQATIDILIADIASSSQFFLNNMLVAAGTEVLFELSQIPRMVYHFILHSIITVEASSKRTLEKLKAPVSLEWGERIPPFIFALLVASIFSTIVPFVTGSCAFFFYIASKVYTHQALFVYAQPYEGGGKLMYQLNRSIFTIIYISVASFSLLLRIKRVQYKLETAFFIVMTIVVVLVDRSITKTFVKPSISLAMTNARVIDEEQKRRQEKTRLYAEYKAEKLQKRREAAKNAAKARLIGKYRESHAGNARASYMPTSLLPPLSESIRTNKYAQQLQLNIETGNLDHELASRVVEPGRGDRLTASSTDSNGTEDDFYLYKQPALNKAFWETAPRPYFD